MRLYPQNVWGVLPPSHQHSCHSKINIFVTWFYADLQSLDQLRECRGAEKEKLFNFSTYLENGNKKVKK